MQYLLTEDEYLAMKAQANAAKKLPNKEQLQEFCTLVADTMPVQEDGWKKGKIWGCILTNEREWYCDDCPARIICPHEFKHLSQ